MILAIVVLGGMGSQMGVVLAAIVLIGLPEVLPRAVASIRMLAFGVGDGADHGLAAARPAGAPRADHLCAAAWKTKNAGAPA